MQIFKLVRQPSKHVATVVRAIFTQLVLQVFCSPLHFIG